MSTEKDIQELKSLSTTLRILPYTLSNLHQIERPPHELWARFFKHHIVIAKRKSADATFPTWKAFLYSSLKELESTNVCLSLEQQKDLVSQVNAKAKEVVTSVSSYQEHIASSQLGFLESNGISFCQEFLFDAVDYYTFWKIKFQKIPDVNSTTDIEVLMLMDNVCRFNDHHKYLEQKILHWPLPMGCFYPRTNNTLELFLSSVPQPPFPKYNSIHDIENIGVVARSLIKEEYDRAIAYLSGYAKQIRQACNVIFPTLVLHHPFDQYRENMGLELLCALGEIEQTNKLYMTKSKFILEDIAEPCHYIEETLFAVKSTGKLAFTANRRVRERILKFLLQYYKDAKTQLKKDKKLLEKIQKRMKDHMGMQLKLKNRLDAYPPWKDALNTVISEVKRGRLSVLTNIYEMQQIYYRDFINALPNDLSMLSFSQSVSKLSITRLF